MRKSLTPVLLSGGIGSRLWPVSRTDCPKPFQESLHGDGSLFAQTLKRLEGLPAAPPIVVCHADHRFLVAEQLRATGQLDAADILLEPHGRNTAPAIAMAALQVIADSGDGSLLVLPTDHIVANAGNCSRLFCVVSMWLPMTGC